MKRICGVLAAAALGGAAAQALAQGELDVTLQVLDDVADIEGVLLEVEEESERAAGRDAEGERDAPPSAGETSRELEPERELEREQTLEGEREDFDVAADIAADVEDLPPAEQ